MKVIAVKNNYKTQADFEPQVYLMADSSLAKSGKPLFLPAYAEAFKAHTHLVVRIGRLGKNIAKKFAHRYVDAVTVGLSVSAEGGAGGAMAQAFDGAAMIGDFIEIDKVADLHNIDIVTSIGGEPVVKFCTATMLHDVYELIEYLSKYFTLKIGDIIYTGYCDDAITLEIGQTITSKLNGEELLEIKIK